MDEFDELSDAEIDALTEMDEMDKGFPNPIPLLTSKERSAASQKAIELPVMRRMKVFEFIRAIPGIGPKRAKEFMLANSVADNRRVGGLSKHRREQVIALGGER